MQFSQQESGNYRGMEYPLEQLPEIWFKLAEEMKEHAKEVEKSDPALSRTFSHRGISIFACAEQLKWSLANRGEPTMWMYARPPTPIHPYEHGQTCSLIRRHDLPGWIETPLFR